MKRKIKILILSVVLIVIASISTVYAIRQFSSATKNYSYQVNMSKFSITDGSGKTSNDKLEYSGVDNLNITVTNLGVENAKYDLLILSNTKNVTYSLKINSTNISYTLVDSSINGEPAINFGKYSLDSTPRENIALDKTNVVLYGRSLESKGSETISISLSSSSDITLKVITNNGYNRYVKNQFMIETLNQMKNGYFNQENISYNEDLEGEYEVENVDASNYDPYNLYYKTRTGYVYCGNQTSGVLALNKDKSYVLQSDNTYSANVEYYKNIAFSEYVNPSEDDLKNLHLFVKGENGEFLSAEESVYSVYDASNNLINYAPPTLDGDSFSYTTNALYYVQSATSNVYESKIFNSLYLLNDIKLDSDVIINYPCDISILNNNLDLTNNTLSVHNYCYGNYILSSDSGSIINSDNFSYYAPKSVGLNLINLPETLNVYVDKNIDVDILTKDTKDYLNSVLTKDCKINNVDTTILLHGIFLPLELKNLGISLSYDLSPVINSGSFESDITKLYSSGAAIRDASSNLISITPKLVFNDNTYSLDSRQILICGTSNESILEAYSLELKSSIERHYMLKTVLAKTTDDTYIDVSSTVFNPSLVYFTYDYQSSTYEIVSDLDETTYNNNIDEYYLQTDEGFVQSDSIREKLYEDIEIYNYDIYGSIASKYEVSFSLQSDNIVLYDNKSILKANVYSAIPKISLNVGLYSLNYSIDVYVNSYSLEQRTNYIKKYINTIALEYTNHEYALKYINDSDIKVANPSDIIYGISLGTKDGEDSYTYDDTYFQTYYNEVPSADNTTMSLVITKPITISEGQKLFLKVQIKYPDTEVSPYYYMEIVVPNGGIGGEGDIQNVGKLFEEFFNNYKNSIKTPVDYTLDQNVYFRLNFDYLAMGYSSLDEMANTNTINQNGLDITTITTLSGAVSISYWIKSASNSDIYVYEVHIYTDKLTAVDQNISIIANITGSRDVIKKVDLDFYNPDIENPDDLLTQSYSFIIPGIYQNTDMFDDTLYEKLCQSYGYLYGNDNSKYLLVSYCNTHKDMLDLSSLDISSLYGLSYLNDTVGFNLSEISLTSNKLKYLVSTDGSTVSDYRIKTLIIHNSKIKDSTFDLTYLKALESFDASNTLDYSNNSILTAPSLFRSVKEVNLANNKELNDIHNVSKYSSVKNLYMQNCNIHSYYSLLDLKNTLKSLYIYDNPFTDTFYNSLSVYDLAKTTLLTLVDSGVDIYLENSTNKLLFDNEVEKMAIVQINSIMLENTYDYSGKIYIPSGFVNSTISVYALYNRDNFSQINSYNTTYGTDFMITVYGVNQRTNAALILSLNYNDATSSATVYRVIYLTFEEV